MVIQLVQPNVQYKQTFIEAVKEFQKERNPNAAYYMEFDLNYLENNFDEFVSQKITQSQGKNLPKGYVPATELWIIDDNQRYLGRVSIRHELNDHLLIHGGHIGYNIRPSERRKGYGSQSLELGLVEAKKLGLGKVLLTCNADNLGSIKIIEKNGGVLENSVTTDEGLVKLRYWIKLA